MSHREYNYAVRPSAGKQKLTVILVVCRLPREPGACTKSVYQALFLPPTHKSLGTRLGEEPGYEARISPLYIVLVSDHKEEGARGSGTETIVHSMSWMSFLIKVKLSPLVLK